MGIWKMLEPNQSLKPRESLVYPWYWGWNDIDRLMINKSTANSTRVVVRTRIRDPIEEITYFQLEDLTRKSVNRNLNDVRT